MRIKFDLNSFEAQQRGSVRLGKILIPLVNATDVLSKYCRQLVLENEEESQPYSLLGSSSMVRINGEYRQIFCSHQIRGRSHEDIRLLPHCNPTKMIRGFQFNKLQTESRDEEIDDICAMSYRPHVYDLNNFEGDFFEVDVKDCWPRQTSSYFCILGYPNKQDSISMDEAGCATGITATIRTIGGHYDGPASASNVHRILLKESGRGVMDGFSGGAVFHLGRDANGFFWGFAGILVRSADAARYAHFIDVDFLLSW